VQLALLAATLSSIALGGTPGFEASTERIEGHVRDRIEGSSWHPGCPVGLSKLRLLRVSHRGFDGDAHRGRLVVHRRYAPGVIAVMRRLYRIGFPIRRMKLIDRYGADDRRSMAADNTSAFNCRFVAGTRRWSMHAYGKAIDINPVENPYVSGSHVSPPAGEPYADRSRRARGMIHAGDEVVEAFRERAGWKWAGAWAGSTRDYQHFSSSGD
jgi:poly-gamma-glutamate synthesis protein (capsule biosynthesis protein)